MVMGTSRRGFLKAGMTASAFSAAALAGKANPALARMVTEPQTPLRPGIHVLGDEVASPDQRLARGMSDDVFERLLKAYTNAFPSRPMWVVAIGQLGEYAPEGRTLTNQWNSSFTTPSAFSTDQQPYFDLAEFRNGTNGWVAGTCIQPSRPGYGGPPSQQVPIAEMFGERRIVGMPMLPSGLQWRAHYVDEDTGLVMRALAYLDIMTDEFICRWDVICG